MQVSVEVGEGLERRVKVELPTESVQSEVDKRLREMARNARLPGFRPGKVPVKLLRQRYGTHLEQEVLGELIQSSLGDALDAEGLRAAGMPRVEPDIDRGAKRYGYTAVFEVLPEIELKPLTESVIRRPVAEVTDADVDAMLDRLRDQRKTFEEVERGAQDGDRVEVSFVGTVDGEPFDGGTADGVEVDLGSGRMIPGFEDGILGAAAGEERTLHLSFPDDYQASDLAGKPAQFAIKVTKVSAAVLPEIDAELAKEFGVEDGDLDRFRGDVRENMQRELKQRTDSKIKDQAMDALLAANQLDVPAALVAEEIKALREQMRENMSGGQLELPDTIFEEQARRRVSLGLIIAEVIKANGLEVDAEKVRETVTEMASTYEHPEAVIKYYYEDAERLSSVQTLVLENMVVDLVLEQARVEDDATTFEQLTAA